MSTEPPAWSGNSRITSGAIKREAAALGFDLCGIATAEPIERGDFFREWLARDYAGSMGYLHRHQDSRIDMRKWLPWARSIIVTAFNYKQPVPRESTKEPCGRIAMYAWGEDYHVVLREKLEKLAAQIRASVEGAFQCHICVDTSAVIEREFAARAGIGWIGKNTLVLNKPLGSMFFLGLIITDLDLPPDSPAVDHCGTCTRCLDACPTSAFPQPYAMDARRCISYLTIEHRGEIDSQLAARMRDWVFGCDICQDVCPYNAKSPETPEARFKTTDSYDALIPLGIVDQWSPQDYHDSVDKKATSRARLEMWKRNAAIVRSNIEMTKSF